MVYCVCFRPVCGRLDGVCLRPCLREGFLHNERGFEMNCDTCPNGFSAEDEICRVCPLFPKNTEKAEPQTVSQPVSPIFTPAVTPPPPQDVVLLDQNLPSAISLDESPEAAPYFEEPAADKPSHPKSWNPYTVGQKIAAVFLAFAVFLGALMMCVGYTVGYIPESKPASHFLNDETIDQLTASLTNNVYFLGVHLERQSVDALLHNKRMQKYLDDVIEAMAVYMRTGAEPTFHYEVMATRIFRILQQNQAVYVSSNGMTYISEAEGVSVLAGNLSQSVDQLLVLFDKQKSRTERLEALRSLTKNTNVNTESALNAVMKVQSLQYLPTGLFWGGLALLLISSGLLIFLNRHRRGRALLFAAIPLFVLGLLFLIVLAPSLLSAFFNKSAAALVEGGLRLIYASLIGPAVFILVTGFLLGCMYFLDKADVISRLWRRIRPVSS